LQKVSAELLAGDHEEGDVGEGQVERLCRCRGGGNDGSIRDLVDDFGTWRELVVDNALQGFHIPSCVSNLL
jgi:hypothetical protein